MTPREVLARCREKDVKTVGLRFADFLGGWRHVTIPVKHLTEDLFEDGLGFDGSSIRGWTSVDKSDMLMVPQPETAFLDPFAELPTLNLICNVQEPFTGEPYGRDPRNIAVKAVNYLASTGIADTACFGPEAEFFIFDNVRYDQDSHQGYYHVDSVEGQWNRGRDESPNLAYKLRSEEGVLPSPPSDQFVNLRNSMMQAMIHAGMVVEAQHHGGAAAGQAVIDLRFNGLVKMADQMMMYKYIVKNMARMHGKTVTFMPKPLYGEHGSGMHTHFSLWREEQPLFAGDGYAGLSETALYAVGGILAHAPAVLAFTNPTTNSYKRLTPGFGAPVNLTYSQRNRSAACRIPMYSAHPSSKRVEFRCPDPSCNPYLAFSAILMAAIDGIQNKISPGDPADHDVYASSGEPAGPDATPASLAESLAALADDHEFLTRGDVFSEDLIEIWLRQKHEHEVDALRMRPHPHEFCMYFDV